MEKSIEELQYPVGRFELPREVTAEQRSEAQSVISSFPEQIITACKHLTAKQLDTPYRPDGWTARQVIHHCADSHMNAYIRFKLALTEESPTIKPYEQGKWGDLADNQLDPVVSVFILDGLHKRWMAIMENMTDEHWKKTFVHPEFSEPQRLEQTCMLYAWHCRHHLAHIQSIK